MVWVILGQKFQILLKYKFDKKMKNKIFIYCILVLLFSSCEKTSMVGGRFIDYYSGKPIQNLEVAFIKCDNYIDYQIKWSEVKIVSTCYTDSNGRFLFEVSSDETIGFFRYAPIYNSDTTSVNSRYVLNENYSMDWGKNGEFKLQSVPLWVEISLTNATYLDTFSIYFDKQIDERIISDHTTKFYFINMKPGAWNSIDIYKIKNREKIFLETKRIFVKHPISEISSERIFNMAPICKINVQLESE